MNNAWLFPDADEEDVGRIAACIALKIRASDTIALHGDLGAGKSTLARALIRALLGDENAEVPSPTFPILQSYETPRLDLAHIDLYRIENETEVEELGVGELLKSAAIVVEWPERAPSLLGPDRLDVAISDTPDPRRRNLSLTGFGSWQPRLARLKSIMGFVDSAPSWRGCKISYLQGDASSRAYARLQLQGRRAILMDWPAQPDGPPVRDGLPYSRIAHLAEGVTAFCEVESVLRERGYSAPEILAQDRGEGLLIIEDLGDAVFGSHAASEQSMRMLWQAGVDTLVELREFMAPALAQLQVAAGYPLPDYDQRALGIEVELLLDWYWPLRKYSDATQAERQTFVSAWSDVLQHVTSAPSGVVLRDYHSPNLIWLPDRSGAKARVGIIDFQDAVRGHPAYDLVSLLQDARLDVPQALERELLGRYIEAASAREASFDAEAFTAAYAILGAQRNTKILGIFARLYKRDGKPAYLKHIPRIWSYLQRNLDHPQLVALRSWYEGNFPPELRTRVLEADRD